MHIHDVGVSHFAASSQMNFSFYFQGSEQLMHLALNILSSRSTANTQRLHQASRTLDPRPQEGLRTVTFLYICLRSARQRGVNTICWELYSEKPFMWRNQIVDPAGSGKRWVTPSGPMGPQVHIRSVRSALRPLLINATDRFHQPLEFSRVCGRQYLEDVMLQPVGLCYL